MSSLKRGCRTKVFFLKTLPFFHKSIFLKIATYFFRYFYTENEKISFFVPD